MPIQQGIRTLPLYDILATLFPGSTLLIGLAIVFGVDASILTSAFAAVFFVIFGYLVGSVLRWFGRKLEGRPVLFSNSRKLATDLIEEDEISAGDGWIKAIVDEVPCYEKKPSDDELRIKPSKIERTFEDYTFSEFGLDKYDHRSIGSGRLLGLLLSNLETTSYSRSIRFQAIHSFHRNTWAALIVIFGASIVAILQKILHAAFAIPSWLIIPHTTLPSWGTLLVIFILSLSLVLVFGRTKEKFNRLFIEYVFAESYLDFQSKESE